MSSPVTIHVTEYGGERTLTWTRKDRDDLTDRGQWSGDPGWVQTAQNALLTRSDVRVAPPDLYYVFDRFDGSTVIADIAAAIIAATNARGDCSQAVAELPAELFDVDDDVPDDAIY